MMNDMGMWGPGWMLAPSLPVVLLLGGAVVAALAAALVATGRTGRLAAQTSAAAAWGDSRAIAVAKERYARGDIDHVELDRILDTVLRGEEYLRGRPR